MAIEIVSFSEEKKKVIVPFCYENVYQMVNLHCPMVFPMGFPMFPCFFSIILHLNWFLLGKESAQFRGNFSGPDSGTVPTMFGRLLGKS